MASKKPLKSSSATSSSTSGILPKDFSTRVLIFVSLGVVIIALIVMISLVVGFGDSSPYSRSSMAYDFSVSESVGVNVGNDSLHFGAAPPGASLQRPLNLTPQHDGRIVLSWEGAGSLSVDKNDFKVASGETVPVEFTLDVPQNLSYGNYSGVVYVDLYES